MSSKISIGTLVIACLIIVVSSCRKKDAWVEFDASQAFVYGSARDRATLKVEENALMYGDYINLQQIDVFGGTSPLQNLMPKYTFYGDVTQIVHHG